MMKPTIYDSPRVSLFSTQADVVNAVEPLIVSAGKTCYRSHGRGRVGADYINHIMAEGHGSVLEHGVIGLRIAGVSRTLTHELVRHRHFSFSQESQRFVAEVPDFVKPPNWMEEVDFEGLCDTWAQDYADALKLLPNTKAGKEVARAVLPGCTATKLVMTGNLRAWRNFILTRAVASADAEMRRLTQAILPVLIYEAPNVFGDITIDAEGVRSTYGKV